MRRTRVTYSVVHLFNIFVLVAPYTVRRVLPVSTNDFTFPKKSNDRTNEQFILIRIYQVSPDSRVHTEERIRT